MHVRSRVNFTAKVGVGEMVLGLGLASGIRSGTVTPPVAAAWYALRKKVGIILG